MHSIHVLLLLHSLWSLFAFFFLRPPNVFSYLSLPLSAPVPLIRSSIRATLTDNDKTIPSHLLGLLTKLNSFDARVIYVRLGHDVLLSCDHCTKTQDYFLYALPSHLLSYVLEMAFIGLITSPQLFRPQRRQNPDTKTRSNNPFISALRIGLPTVPLGGLRKLGVGSLVAASVMEAYYKVSGKVVFSAPGESGGEKLIMWHDYLLLLRMLYTFILPLVIYTLSPPSPPPSPQSHLPLPPVPLLQLQSMTMQCMQAVLSHTKLSKAMTAAIMRDEVLSERAVECGEKRRAVAEGILGAGDLGEEMKPDDGDGDANIWKALVDLLKSKDASVNLSPPERPATPSTPVPPGTSTPVPSGDVVPPPDAVSVSLSTPSSPIKSRSQSQSQRRERPAEEVEVERRLRANAKMVARNMFGAAGIDVDGPPPANGDAGAEGEGAEGEGGR